MELIRDKVEISSATKRWHHPYACRDSKNREIGSLVKIGEVEVYERERQDKWECGYSYKPGRYFTAWVQAARDGKSYGASQSGEWFTTEAERDAYVERRLAAGRKRALNTK